MATSSDAPQTAAPSEQVERPAPPDHVWEVPLWLPRPRFGIGDAVKVDGLIAVVGDILLRGRWSMLGREGQPTVHLDYYCYRLIAQRGSVVEGTAMRPGIVCDLEGHMVDATGEAREPIYDAVGPDDAGNVEQRHAAWVAGYDGYPPGGPHTVGPGGAPLG